jgi:hypothetical protein
MTDSRCVPRRQVQHRNKCGALIPERSSLLFHPSSVKVDGVSITGDLPLLSLGRKIVLQVMT